MTAVLVLVGAAVFTLAFVTARVWIWADGAHRRAPTARRPALGAHHRARPAPGHRGTVAAMTVQPSMDDLNQARIVARVAEWARAGREIYRQHALGVTQVDPGDIISRAERPDHQCKEPKP